MRGWSPARPWSSAPARRRGPTSATRRGQRRRLSPSAPCRSPVPARGQRGRHRRGLLDRLGAAQITGELTAVRFQQGGPMCGGAGAVHRLIAARSKGRCSRRKQSRARHRRRAANARPSGALRTSSPARIVAREQRDNARTNVARLEATLASDRAAVENAKVQLQYATIKAPISGRTGVLMVNAGNLVRANDQAPLVTINQVSPIYVSFSFPEPLLPDLRRYQSRGSLGVEARPSSATIACYRHDHLHRHTLSISRPHQQVKARSDNDRQLWPAIRERVRRLAAKPPPLSCVPLPCRPALKVRTFTGDSRSTVELGGSIARLAVGERSSRRLDCGRHRRDRRPLEARPRRISVKGSDREDES